MSNTSPESLSDKDKTTAIMDALKEKHIKDCWVAELAFTDRRRRIDLFAIAATAGKGYVSTSYEVKVSKQDFKRDTHEKQREARLYSEFFWYVTPPNLVKKEDIPDWAGLMILADNGRLKVVVPAPRTAREVPSWELVVSMLRYSGTCHRDVTNQQLNAIKSLDNAHKRNEEWSRAFGYAYPDVDAVRRLYTYKDSVPENKRYTKDIE